MVSTSSSFCYSYKFYFSWGLLFPITLHLIPHPSLHIIHLEILNIFIYLNILSLSFLFSLNFDFPGRMSFPWQLSISFSLTLLGRTQPFKIYTKRFSWTVCLNCILMFAHVLLFLQLFSHAITSQMLNSTIPKLNTMSELQQCLGESDF